MGTTASYSAAGSFVTYLIDAGQSNPDKIQKYKELLRQIEKCNSNDEVLASFINVFDSSFSKAEAEWKKFLGEWKEDTVNVSVQLNPGI